MNIAIIGTGAYSLAMACVLGQNKHHIKMWTESTVKVLEFKETGKLDSILSDVEIPKSLEITTSYEEVIEDVEIIFIMTATKFLSSVCAELSKYYTNQHIVVASKGIEQGTNLFPDQIAEKFFDTDKIAVISGPSFAIDMAKFEPVGLTIASNNQETINITRKALENTTVKLWPHDDTLGVEICGSVKNVIAIASGIINGLGYSESTSTFLINEALHDLKELIIGLGGDKKAILSFAGVGDLLLTCTSKKSRNFTFGYKLGKNEEPFQYLKETTVEGYYTLESIYSLVKDKNIDIPLIKVIYEIVMTNKNPKNLIKVLMKKK